MCFLWTPICCKYSTRTQVFFSPCMWRQLDPSLLSFLHPWVIYPNFLGAWLLDANPLIHLDLKSLGILWLTSQFLLMLTQWRSSTQQPKLACHICKKGVVANQRECQEDVHICCKEGKEKFIFNSWSMMITLFNIFYKKMIHQQFELFGILHETKYLTPMLRRNSTFAIMTFICKPTKGVAWGCQ